jgi:hypothetical protein
MLCRSYRPVAIGALTITVVGLLSVPVMAEIDRLTKLPLGKGTATISWTGNSGITPTINSISGTARGQSIVATGTLPRPSSPGGSSSGSTSLTIPSSLPLADIKGTIGGTPFTVDITLKLSGLSAISHKVETFGSVTGAFRGQPIKATLFVHPPSSLITFTGSIGSDHVTGTIPINRIVHHGKRSTAYATFDVTK